MKYILAIDIGTSSIKAFVSDPYGNRIACVSEPYPTYSPKPYWLEQRPEDWMDAMRKAITSIPSDIREQICCISFSGHMSSIILVNDEGKAISKCLLLSDLRGKDYTSRLKDYSEYTKTICGNLTADYSWILKAKWLLDQEDIKGSSCKALFVKDYLRFILTGKIGSEYTDCGNTGLMNYITNDWDLTAVEKSGIPFSILPEIHAPYEKAGTLLRDIARILGLTAGIPVFYGGADMACASLGSGIKPDGSMISITLGSCATMFATIRKGIDISNQIGKITFHPYIFPESQYMLGSHFTGGQGLNWFSSLFSGTLEADYSMLSSLSLEAEKEPVGSNGVLFLPFMAGSGSPYNRGSDISAYTGMTFSTSRGTMFRAMLEGISMNLFDTFQTMVELLPEDSTICIGGGGVNVKSFPQIIADIFGRNIYKLTVKDASALGAAMLASYGSSMSDTIYPSSPVSDEIIKYNSENHDTYQKLFLEWKSLYNRLEN